jgi:hypothetical protein
MTQAGVQQTEQTPIGFTLECLNLTCEPVSYAEASPGSNSKSSHSKYSLSFLKSRVTLLHEMICGSGCGRLIRSSISITASTLLSAD